MNQPVREAIPTPRGWLVSPTREFCMFFIRDPKSEMAFPRVYTQLWYCLEDGTPTKLKNTRRIDLESAIETWHELLTQDWELMEHQINDAAAQSSNQISKNSNQGDGNNSISPNGTTIS